MNLLVLMRIEAIHVLSVQSVSLILRFIIAVKGRSGKAVLRQPFPQLLLPPLFRFLRITRKLIRELVHVWFCHHRVPQVLFCSVRLYPKLTVATDELATADKWLDIFQHCDKRRIEFTRC